MGQPDESRTKLDKSTKWSFYYISFGWVHAGIAQLVERELPKLEVASSNLVARSTSDLSGGMIR
jgi:hypothetical protein